MQDVASTLAGLYINGAHTHSLIRALHPCYMLNRQHASLEVGEYTEQKDSRVEALKGDERKKKAQPGHLAWTVLPFGEQTKVMP